MSEKGKRQQAKGSYHLFEHLGADVGVLDAVLVRLHGRRSRRRGSIGSELAALGLVHGVIRLPMHLPARSGSVDVLGRRSRRSGWRRDLERVGLARPSLDDGRLILEVRLNCREKKKRAKQSASWREEKSQFGRLRAIVEWPMCALWRLDRLLCLVTSGIDLNWRWQSKQTKVLGSANSKSSLGAAAGVGLAVAGAAVGCGRNSTEGAQKSKERKSGREDQRLRMLSVRELLVRWRWAAGSGATSRQLVRAP